MNFVAELNFVDMNAAKAAEFDLRDAGFEVRILYDAIDPYSAAVFMNIAMPGDVDRTNQVETIIAPWQGFLAASGVTNSFDLEMIPDNGRQREFAGPLRRRQ